MIHRVTVGTGDFNNAEWIARSKAISFFKILYYRVLAMAYGFCGQFTDIVMCNSTWTLNHIESLWFAKKRTPRCRIVFPPCDTSVLRVSISGYTCSITMCDICSLTLNLLFDG